MTSNYGFPDPTKTRKEKSQPSYGLDYIKWFWNQCNKLSPVFNETLSRDKNNRKAAAGLMSVVDITQQMGVNNQKPDNSSYLNIDTSPVSLLPKLVDITVSQLLSQKYDVQCIPLDPESKTIQDDEFNKMKANMYLRDIDKKMGISQRTGLSLVPPGTKLPENEEDAEIYFELNGKRGLSLAVEQIIRFIQMSNSFEQSSIPKIARDFVVLEKAAVMRDYDSNNMPIYKYVDWVKLGFPYSAEDDFNSIPAVYLREDMTIGDIAKLAKKEDGSPMYSEKELKEIAQKFEGQAYKNPNWNPGWNGSYEGYYNSATLVRPYYNFVIPVCRFWFRSVNEEFAVKTTKNGKSYIDYKGEYVEQPNKELVGERKMEWRYGGYWIIDSDYIFNYGEDDKLEREKINGGYSPYAPLPIHMMALNIYDMQNKSRLERGLPMDRQIQIINQKIQAVLLRFKPETVSINEAVLTDLKIGKGDDDSVHSSDSYDRFELTGTFVYHATDGAGNPANIDPLRVIPSDAVNRLNALYEARAQEVKNLYDVWGYNDAMNAQLPTGEVSVGAQQLARNATIASLKPLYQAMLQLVENSTKGLIPMIQDLITYKKEAFIQAIGVYAVDIIELYDKIPLVSLGIKVTASPTEDEYQRVMQLLQVDMEKNGLLTSADIMEIDQTAKVNISLAGRLISVKIERAKKRKQADAEAIVLQNGQTQQQSTQVAGQVEAQRIQMQLEADIKKLTVDSQLKDSLDDKAFQRAYKLQELKNTGMEVVAGISNEGKVDVAKETANAKKVTAVVESQTVIAKTEMVHHSDHTKIDHQKEADIELQKNEPKEVVK
jgi:hypothetical protein